MTTYFVSASGTNTSPYDTWVKAATDYDTVDVLLANGDTVYVENTYSKTWASDKSLPPVGTADLPVTYISSTTGDVYTPGAEFKCVGGTYDLDIGDGSVNWYGFDLEAQTGMTWADPADTTICHDCNFTFAVGNSSFPTFGKAEFYGCTFTTSNTEYVFYLWSSNRVYLYNCTIIAASMGSGDSLFYINSSADGQQHNLIDCDLTNGGANTFSYLWSTVLNHAQSIYLKNCRIPVGLAVSTAVISGSDSWALLEGCYSGTDTVSNAWQMLFQERGHQVEAVDTHYRTGGASDGETTYAWELVPVSTAGPQLYLRTRPISRWVAAGSQTLTFYFASGASLDDDEIWVELESPSEAATATAQHKWQTTLDFMAGSVCTIDNSSVWNGTGVGTKQKITISISPTEAGLITGRICLAKNQTVYLDPTIESSVD